MNRLFYIFLFFVSLSTYAQDLQKVDVKVLNYPNYYEINQLTKKIAKDFKTDLEKVRAVYTWIANNVAYSYKAKNYQTTFTYQSKEELKEKLKISDKKIAVSAFKKRIAVCHGYTSLFNEMCSQLNIKSWYVSGKSKTTPSDILINKESSHAWNIVEINSKKYLIDVTWGAGSYNRGVGFEKDISYFYFLTEPNLFIKNHYPDHYKNSLLENKTSLRQFQEQPVYYINNNPNFELIKPKKGKINKHVNTKVTFVYKFNEEIEWVSYLMDDNFIEINDYVIKDNLLIFKIDFYNNEANQVLI